jgi:hypothetical protein
VNRAGLSGQEEEGGLKDVIGGHRISEDPPGRAVDEPPVPADDFGKRRLVPPGREGGQQFRIGRSFTESVNQGHRRMEGTTRDGVRHRRLLRGISY